MSKPQVNALTADWWEIGPLAELPEGRPVRRDAGPVPVVVVREGGEVHALADSCGHMGGPLSEGTIDNGCVTCPWHGRARSPTAGRVNVG